MASAPRNTHKINKAYPKKEKAKDVDADVVESTALTARLNHAPKEKGPVTVPRGRLKDAVRDEAADSLQPNKHDVVMWQST